MLKFFKITVLWIVTVIVTIVLAGGFAYLGIDWMAKITLATFAGYVYLLVTSLFFTGFGRAPLSTVVWWTAIFHVVTCSAVDDSDAMFVIGPIVGIAICYWLMKNSYNILTSRSVAAQVVL